MMAATSAPSMLTPSQAINGDNPTPPARTPSSPAAGPPTQEQGGGGASTRPRPKRRGGGGGASRSVASDAVQNGAASIEGGDGQAASSSAPEASRPTSKGRRGRNKKGAPGAARSNGVPNLEQEGVDSDERHHDDAKRGAGSHTVAEETSASMIKRNKNRRKGGKTNKKGGSRSAAADSRYPWRKHIPDDTVDPITLEPLKALPYPPFALVAAEPYLPVEEWPVVPQEDEGGAEGRSASDKAETEQERHDRVLREQWGDKLSLAAAAAATTTTSAAATASSLPSAVAGGPPPGASEAVAAAASEAARVHYHLYDGRALAYYCVSQLQFIDPLNRRDLTRDELINLDHYLRRHGFNNLNVVEAYDVKGVTISSAGAAGNTAAGRAAILQQEARVLLNALFGGISVAVPNQRNASRPAPANRSLRHQYQSHEESQQRQYDQHLQEQHELQERQQQPSTLDAHDLGIYGDGAGYVVIDDDLNPGLRGRYAEAALQQARRQQPLARGVQAGDFPSLAETVAPAPALPPQPVTAPVKKALPPSTTLSRIATSVKKTDPEEQQRQWEAREEARRKAMLSNMTFGNNLVALDGIPGANAQLTSQQSIPQSVSVQSTKPISEGQLQRNQALAAALGVTPSTVRQQQQALLGGWARPSEPRIEVDEFGRELQCNYPDELILQAKERMGLLVKVEKKLIKFLSDDASPSLPLNPMDRSSRALVHEYLDFWKLQAQSYDPEPKRYIQCTKQADTCAPYPLLSDAVRNWRGPRPVLASLTSAPASSTIASLQGRDIPAAPPRVPLPLKPRSTSLERPNTREAVGVSIGGIPARSRIAETSLDTTNSRVETLVLQRERPKLQLAQRSLPLELPPYVPPQKYDVSEELQRRRERMQVQAQKEQDRIRQQQAVLEAAFASDEDSVGSNGGSESEWEEQEAQYVASGDEEE